MLTKFKLVKRRFSKVDQEWQWTYACLFTFTFKKQVIHQITITGHYQVEHNEVIDNQLILNLLLHKVNGLKRLKPLPDSYLLWKRNVFRFDTTYQNENYRLIFWFKDNTTNHLWVRNCYPQN